MKHLPDLTKENYTVIEQLIQVFIAIDGLPCLCCWRNNTLCGVLLVM
jgi:hypothetical protein